MKLLLSNLYLASAIVNFTRCPHPWEIQSEKLLNSYDFEMHNHFYYEIASEDFFHITECPKRTKSCMTMNRYYDPNPPLPSSDNAILPGAVMEDWSSQCGRQEPEKSLLNLQFTENPGQYMITRVNDDVPDQFKIPIPVTIADYKLSPDGKSYEWFIEVTCNNQEGRVTDEEHIRIQTVTFYSQHYNISDAYYEEVINAGYAVGLGPWMDWEVTDGTEKVPLFDCGYDSEEMVDIYDEPQPTTTSTANTEITTTSTATDLKSIYALSIILFMRLAI